MYLESCWLTENWLSTLAESDKTYDLYSKIDRATYDLHFWWSSSARPRKILSHDIQFIQSLGGHLRYKSEGRGFESRWCQWNFSLT